MAKKPNPVAGCLAFLLVSIGGGIGIVAWLSSLPEPTPEELVAIDRKLMADDVAKAQLLATRIEEAKRAGLHREAARLEGQLEKVLGAIERSKARIQRTLTPSP